MDSEAGFSFTINHAPEKGLASVGTISTPHGDIQTPAFIPVGTKANVKTVLPEAMEDLGAQALLANAYHLYLQPGPDVLDEAGGLGAFMKKDGGAVMMKNGGKAQRSKAHAYLARGGTVKMAR